MPAIVECAKSHFLRSLATLVLVLTAFGLTSASLDKKWSYGAGGYLFATPEQACQGFVDKEKEPGLKTKIKPAYNSDGTAKPDVRQCYYLDKNNNNKEEYFSFVYEVDVPDIPTGNDNEPATPEDPCEETVPGPYRDVKPNRGTIIAKGRDYTPEQKRQVLDENVQQNGRLRPDDPSDPCYERGLTRPPTGLTGVYPKPAKDPCEAQVDHHIPRLDKNGKPCGSNSFNNARVSSSAANNRKSNNMPGTKKKTDGTLKP